MPEPPLPDCLRFESRFESGNLAKVIRITEAYYEIYLRPDYYTSKHCQWFYFQVSIVKLSSIYEPNRWYLVVLGPSLSSARLAMPFKKLGLAGHILQKSSVQLGLLHDLKNQVTLKNKK